MSSLLGSIATISLCVVIAILLALGITSIWLASPFVVGPWRVYVTAELWSKFFVSARTAHAMLAPSYTGRPLARLKRSVISGFKRTYLHPRTVGRW